MAAQLSETGVLLGRAQEMARLLDALDSAIRGAGRLVILGGEAGIGKTRLADAIAAEARQRGARVLWGSCWEAGGAPAFWPWVQAIRGYLRDTDAAAVRAALGPGAVDVVRIVPELRDVLPDLPEPPPETDEGQRFRIFAAMSSFLARVAASRPLVLILDDLHAADEPSLLLLRFLASEISDTRLLVIAIYRDDEVDAAGPISGILAELPRTPAAERLSPRALEVEDVSRYLETVAGGTPRPGLAEAVQRETEGNPLFMTEVVRLLIDEGRLDRPLDPTGRGFGVTEGVRAVIRRRLARLSVPCVDLLGRASILGGEVSRDLLARLEERPPDALVDLLDEAAAARVLAAPATPGGPWRFVHGIFREVLYGALPTSTRVQLHQRVAELLEDLSRDSAAPPYAELAHHFVAAGGGPKAVEYARRAAEAATELHGHEEAARLYRLALAVGDLKDRQRCELQIALGGALARAGNAAEARAEFLAAAAIADRLGLAEELARAAVGYGGQFVWLRAGSDETLVPLLERALAALGSRNDALRVRLLARLSGALRDEHTIARRDAISAEAVELARRVGDPVALGHALVARTWAIRAPDRTAEIDELIAELQTLAPTTNDRELVLDGHWVRFNQMRVVGADQAALHAELNALQHAKAELHQPHRLHEAVERSILGLMEGRLADVEGYLPGLERAPDPFSVLAGTFLLRREQDRLEEVAASVRAAVHGLPGYPLLITLVAYLDARLGRSTAAAQTLDRLAADRYSAISWDWGWTFAMMFLGETAILVGSHERGREIEGLLAPYASFLGSASGEGSSGPVSRVLGLLAAFDGRLDEGLASLEAASRQSAWMGATLWETRIAVERAEILLQRGGPGDRQAARDLLTAAMQTARELGLVAIGRQAERAFARLEPGEAATPAPGHRAGAAVADDAPSPPAPEATFHREGDTWAIAFESPFRLRDSKGLRYLAVLLAEPGREFHALDLVGRVDGAPAGVSAAAQEAGAIVGNAGLTVQAADTGTEILDDQARAAYRGRIRELSAELEEAEAFNDPARAERAREEIDALEAELAAAFGLGGRARSAISPAERARQSVSKAIRESLRRIEGHDAVLHGHLVRSVRTGIYCSYDPDPSAIPRWRF